MTKGENKALRLTNWLLTLQRFENQKHVNTDVDV